MVIEMQMLRAQMDLGKIKFERKKDMPTFKVGLSRTYLVTVQANDSESAKRAAECFVGESDLSQPNERNEFGFKIDEIEIVNNETFDCDDENS